MDRVLAVTVVLLAHSMPHLCRRLPTPDLSLLPDLARSGIPSASSERYSLFPTLIASAPPSIEPSEPDIDLLPAVVSVSSVSTPDSLISSVLQSHPDFHTDYLSVPKHRRKIVIDKFYNDKGKLRTKFPNKKHLVEIVPLRHKTKIAKIKGNALAYILPKSKIIKRIPDLSESSEEDSSDNDSLEQKESNDYQNSFSIESNSLEYYDPQLDHTATYHHNKGLPKHTASNSYKNTASQNKIDNKLNDIVQYLKEHNQETLDKLIHDIVPDTEDTDHRVHYIIRHKNHQPNKHNHDLSDDNDVTSEHVHNSETNKHPAHGAHHRVDENIRHREPIETLTAENLSDEYNIIDDSSTTQNNKEHNHHYHNKIDRNENSEFRDVHYILENTNQGPVLLPSVITENEKQYPEIIIHTHHHSDPHDVQHYKPQSDIVPEFITHISGHDPMEHHQNAINHNVYPEIKETAHDLIDHVYPDLNHPYIKEHNNLLHGENPDGNIHEIIETPNMIIYGGHGDHEDNPIVIESSEINSNSNNSESPEDSSSSGSDEGSEGNIAFIPDTNASKPKVVTVGSDSSSPSDSNLKSDEYEENSNTDEKSADISDGYSNILQMPNYISPDIDARDNNSVTSENTSSSDEDSTENIQSGDILAEDFKDIKTLPNCAKLKMIKKKCNKHKLYKLIFLFNR